jgi:predicted dehydrogenase
MASHVLDYLVWTFGEIERLQLQPATLVPFRPDAQTGQPKTVLADDTCNFLMKLAPDLPANVTISTAVAVTQGHRMRAWFEYGLLELANAPGDDYQDGFKITFQAAKNVRSELGSEVNRAAKLSGMKAERPGKIEVTRRMVGQFALALARQENLAPSVQDALKVQEYMELARQTGW